MTFMLNVVMLNVVMLNVVMLNVVMLNVVVPFSAASSTIKENLNYALVHLAFRGASVVHE